MLKKGKIVVALLCLGSIASAQSVVTLGTFGFTKDTAAIDAGFNISGMQFYSSTNSPEALYGSNLPVGSKIYLWNGSGYDISEYQSNFIPPPEGPKTVMAWNIELDLANGSGYWVEVPSASTNTLSGDVPMEDSITNSIVAGFQLCSFPYPVDRVVTNLGFDPSIGDKIYLWNGSGYDISEYQSNFIPPPEGPKTVEGWNDDGSFTIAAGEGFWYESVSVTNWVADRPYNKN